MIPQQDMSNTPTDMLISYILDRFHLVHRAELQVLCPLAKKVEEVHAGHPQCPRGLGHFLDHLNAELTCHMHREEMVLFPMMTEGGDPMIAAPIAVMSGEHEDHQSALRDLAALTHGFIPPTDACGSWRKLYLGLHKLHDDLTNHIKLENEVLFPRFSDVCLVVPG
jgi:regulator of cell morphogenesis and NO signaling